MDLLPGIVLVGFIGIIAHGINTIYAPLSSVLIAIFIGFIVKNTIGVKEVFRPGARFAVRNLLKWAIILLGVRLSFYDLINIGASSIWIIITCIVLALTVTTVVAKLFKVPTKLGTLIAVGTAICGNSAAIATAGAIGADDEEVAFAVGTITFFGVMALIVYPLVGKLLGLSDLVFGTWAGTAINDTAQVVTAGFIYSPTAGEIATVIKLTRNLFMAPVVFFYSIIYAMSRAHSEKVDYIKIFPWFVLGFVGMAIVRTTGVLSMVTVGFLNQISNFLILLAVAGIGLGLDFNEMKRLGFSAFYTGFIASIVVGLVSLLLVTHYIGT